MCGDVGAVVIAVDYRLAPEHPFPAAVVDCYAALQWVAGNALDLNVDAARIAVGGCSAGGGLAAAVALMARDRGGPAISFQCLLYPALDDRLVTPSSIESVDARMFNRAQCVSMWRAYLKDHSGAVPAYAAPARSADLGNLPPAWVMTAELDPLRDEGIDYALRMLRAGVAVELHQFAGVFHGFNFVGAATQIGARALAEMSAVMRAALHTALA